MGDHTEAITIDYDPKLLSYDDLLGYFWRGHRCSSVNSSRQYRNAVFYRNDEQRRLAEASRALEANRLGIAADKVTSDIVAMGTFTYAEGYHQKYYLGRHDDIRKFLNTKYPTSKALADSTVAMRLNAYLGSGMRLNWKAFLEEMPSYGLPEQITMTLSQVAERSLKR